MHNEEIRDKLKILLYIYFTKCRKLYDNFRSKETSFFSDCYEIVLIFRSNMMSRETPVQKDVYLEKLRVRYKRYLDNYHLLYNAIVEGVDSERPEPVGRLLSRYRRNLHGRSTPALTWA